MGLHSMGRATASDDQSQVPTPSTTPSSSRQTDLEKGGNNLLLPSPTRMIPDFGDLCGLTQGSIALHFQISAVGKNLSFQAFRWGSRGIVEARGY